MYIGMSRDVLPLLRLANTGLLVWSYKIADRVMRSVMSGALSSSVSRERRNLFNAIVMEGQVTI